MACCPLFLICVVLWIPVYYDLISVVVVRLPALFSKEDEPVARSACGANVVAIECFALEAEAGPGAFLGEHGGVFAQALGCLFQLPAAFFALEASAGALFRRISWTAAGCHTLARFCWWLLCCRASVRRGGNIFPVCCCCLPTLFWLTLLKATDLTRQSAEPWCCRAQRNELTLIP